MKTSLKMTLCIGVLIGNVALYALDNPMEAKNWGRQYSCSGKDLKIAFDEPEHAMRFIARYGDNVKDRWLYPSIALTSEDQECNVLTFEIRAVQNPAGRRYKNCLVMFFDKKGKRLGSLEFDAPTEKYSTITLIFDDRLKFRLSDVAKIRIGLNTRDAQEVVMFLRNLRFEKK